MVNHPNRSKQGKWRPIETAPRDGTPVLLWGVAMTPVIGRYWRDGDMGGMRACWTYAMSPSAPETSGPIPIHWMPIPPPPLSL